MNPTLPLHGIRVLDFSQMMAGPLAGMLLGDFGADVVKIESPAGDPLRRTGETRIGGESEYYLSLNRNKRSIVLDLKAPDDLATARRLAGEADVVLENFRPGTADRLGIGYDALRASNPRLVYCALSGFGSDGVHRDRPALDPVIQAMSGIMQLTGTEGSGPLRSGFPISDFATPLLAVSGILAALVSRNATGLGKRIDLSMLDATIFSLLPREGYYFATGRTPPRSGNGHYQIAPYNCYGTADGRRIFVIGHDERYWAAIVRALELPSLQSDPRFGTASARHANRTALDEVLAQQFATRPMADWERRLTEQGALFSAVRSWDEVFGDPQVDRDMVARTTHPTAGPIRLLANPLRFDGVTLPIRRPPPELGEHAAEIMAALVPTTRTPWN